MPGVDIICMIRENYGANNQKQPAALPSGSDVVQGENRLVIAAAALLTAAPVLAHHASSMFDPQKRIVLAGTVREFQWTNPHCWIQLLVSDSNDASAAPSEYSIEMASPIQVFQGGWKPGTLKPGDKIVVTIHPTRDGSKGGVFIAATGPSGQPLDNLRAE